MAIYIVGELKEALKEFDDNMPLDLYACCYDRNNYICIKRDNDKLEDKEPLGLCVTLDNGFVKIENEYAREMELGY